MFLQDKDNVNMLSAFVVMFSFHAAPWKDKLKKQLSEVRFKTHQDNVDSGVDPEDLEHPCIADFLTSTDIAYTIWQYINSVDDWDRKLKSINDGEGKSNYKTRTRYTSSKKEAVSQEGHELYAKLAVWCRELKVLSQKNTDDYLAFQKACNNEAMKRGIIKVWTTPRKSSNREVTAVTPEEDEPAEFDVSELDDVTALAEV